MKGALTNGAVTSNMFLSFGSSPRTSVISRLIKVVLGSAKGQCCLIKNPSGAENLAEGSSALTPARWQHAPKLCSAGAWQAERGVPGEAKFSAALLQSWKIQSICREAASLAEVTDDFCFHLCLKRGLALYLK